MAKPLEGIRVLDWTIFQQGPVAAMMLADLGADVIKLEDRVTGDPSRGMMKLLGAMLAVEGRNAYYEFNNRGKRGITLDWRKQKAKEIVYGLVEKSDVFIHNHRRDVPKKAGLDYETLSKINPKLIYCNCSGWGPHGPRASEGSADATAQAMSGLMTSVEEGYPPMLNFNGGVGDQMGAIMGAYGIMTALFVRERQGIGQEINASLLGSLSWLQGLGLAMSLIMGREMRHTPRAESGNPLWCHYKCKDDKWIMLAHLQPTKFWSNVCKALGLEHIENDPRFSTIDAMSENRVELISIFDKAFASKTRDEWMERLKENGAIYSALNALSDLANDEQMTANNYIMEYNHASWGHIRIPGLPILFGKTPGEVRAEAPEFGEHTEQVLQELLGYSWEDITKLKDEEVI